MKQKPLGQSANPHHALQLPRCPNSSRGRWRGGCRCIFRPRRETNALSFNHPMSLNHCHSVTMSLTPSAEPFYAYSLITLLHRLFLRILKDWLITRTIHKDPKWVTYYKENSCGPWESDMLWGQFLGSSMISYGGTIAMDFEKERTHSSLISSVSGAATVCCDCSPLQYHRKIM